MALLNSVFDVTYGNKFDLNKMERTSRSNGGISFVGRSEKNLGVSATVRPIPNVPPYPAGLITVALGGSILCSYVQQFPFYTAQNVAVLSPKEPLSFNQLIFVCLCIKANKFRYGTFGREANRTLRTLEIPEPSEFPGWLKEVGKEDSISAAPARPERLVLDTSTWRAFKLGEIFEIRKGARLTKADQRSGSTPYLGAIDRNNGVSNYISAPPQHSGGTITVNYNGSVAEAFYQPVPFWASDDVNVLYPRQGCRISPAVGIFVATVIRLEKYRFSYGRKWGLDRMNSSEVKLPAHFVKGVWEPDWAQMEMFVDGLPYTAMLA